MRPDLWRATPCHRTSNIERVLVVEGDDAFRTSLARAFFRGGSEIFEARTSAAASDLLRKKRPDVVITEVHLADATAFELLDVACDLSPAPVVIAISEKASPEETFRLAQRGVRGYLTKPFSLKALRATIESALTDPPDLEPHIAAAVGLVPLRHVQSDVRRIMVREALARADGNRSEAARLLKISRQAVQQSLRSPPRP